MAAITISGVLTKVESKKIVDPDYLGIGRYSPNSERYLNFVNCCLQGDDGIRYFFDSPKVSQVVSSCPGAAVVTFDLEGEASNWFAEIEGSGVATKEKANTNGIRPLIKIGDKITIRASVKAVKPTYTSLNRVKKK